MGKLSFEQGKFWFNVTETMRDDKRAGEAGFKWDADTLRWVTRSPAKARALRRFADASAEQKFKKYFITDFAPPEQITYPDGEEPFLCQIESAWHCTTRSPAYCADEAGLGKTIVAALCMNSVPGNVLVICPPGLKYNWHGEITRWCLGKMYCEIVHGENMNHRGFDANIVILPDSLLTREDVQREIAKRKWVWMFVDEAHRFKTDKARRATALLGEENGENESGLISLAERVVFLSGTPIPNGRPIELYPVLSNAAPESISWRLLPEYGKDFCGARRVVRYEGKKAIVNWDYSGTSNLKTLRRELRTKFMIRHLKRDHLKELGPKTRKLIFLDTPEKLHKMEARLLNDFTLEQLMEGERQLGDIATYRKEVGEIKTIPAFSYLHDLLENTQEKLVVFAHHVSVVEDLARMLRDFGSLMIRGKMSARDKQSRVEEFQNNPKARVIVCNIVAGGLGHTMTRAPRCVFVEYSWNPGENEQAEDRIHRISQNDNVYCNYLVLRNSLDERMLLSVLNKKSAIAQVMD